MKYRKMGKTDMTVSEITFGCWEMGGNQWTIVSDEGNAKAVRVALDNGITTFDTAERYGFGHSEEILAQGLGSNRKDVFISTKVARENLRPADMRTAIAGSLKRLNTDYIDLYYIHWPNPEVAIEDTMAEMVKLKEEGLIRSIGVSNFGIDLLNQAMAIGRIDAIQPEYSLLFRDIDADVRPWCIENDVAIMSYSSIAQGILTGAFHFGGVKLPEDDFRWRRRLFANGRLEKETPLINYMKEICDAKGITMSQLAIAWLLQREGMTSAIVGTQSEKHLLENLGALDVTLSADEEAQLDKISMEVIATFNL